MALVDLNSEFKNIVIDDNNINFGLTINSVGYKTILQNEKLDGINIEKFKFHYKKGKISNEYKLIYITSGSGFVCFENSTEIEISKGKILLINPNQKYTYYHLNDNDWNEYFMRFETDLAFSILMKKFFPAENIIIDVGFNEELVKLFQRAIDVVRNGLKSSQVYLSGMLFHILGLIISESKNKKLEKKELQYIEQVKVIMNENIYNEISMQDIAGKINISYSLFRKNFKKHTGETPAKYFYDLKLEKSRQLLLESAYSIKEISFMLQFSSNEHFSIAFKKMYGLSPRNLRLKELKK
ncbi:MAG: AraC family transcriptional regulator [Paludibacter sp.]|nr:AraC family transcriptional regulator [Paludibacter sp.]